MPSMKTLKEQNNCKSAISIFKTYKGDDAIVCGVGSFDKTCNSWEWVKKHLIENCKLKPATIYKIMREIVQATKYMKPGIEKIYLSQIIVNPFNFLNENYQLLSLFLGVVLLKIGDVVTLWDSINSVLR